ncbi:barstar family protein [Acinetobacter nosocomialis]|uniref:barstar family protein n=1 Tax=Acinetobacter nosocomialis TaxID=106654 RepID=UPI0026F0D35E|nr:hypothetical protein [Acinetobacter nosocomialis]MDO7211181.1 hypothetical protein [Acinetobacter nosocomialis]
MGSELTEEYIFYIEISEFSEFDDDVTIWSGYLSENCVITDTQVVFHGFFGEGEINKDKKSKKYKYDIYGINLFFLKENNEYFGVLGSSIESFEVKDNKLILNLCEEQTSFDNFKIDLIKKYRKNQLKLQDWCNLNEEEKKKWIEVSHWVQQYKPLDLVSSIVIDGRNIKSFNDFLCCIGEEVNGLMGYFGSSFGGLSDSLTGGIGCITVPLNITWKYFEETKYSFNNYDNPDDFEYLIELLNEESTLKLM